MDKVELRACLKSQILATVFPPTATISPAVHGWGLMPQTVAGRFNVLTNRRAASFESEAAPSRERWGYLPSETRGKPLENG